MGACCFRHQWDKKNHPQSPVWVTHYESLGLCDTKRLHNDLKCSQAELYNSGKLLQYVIVLSFISLIERSTALITLQSNVSEMETCTYFTGHWSLFPNDVTSTSSRSWIERLRLLICIYYKSQCISAVCVCVLHAGPGGSSLSVLPGCLVWFWWTGTTSAKHKCLRKTTNTADLSGSDFFMWSMTFKQLS